MYAIEFETKLNNGMLEISIQYKKIRECDDKQSEIAVFLNLSRTSISKIVKP